MPFPSKCWAYRGPDAEHDFHPISGWCEWGCGRRDDGYQIHTISAATIVPAPEYTPDQLANFARTFAEETYRAAQQPLNLSA